MRLPLSNSRSRRNYTNSGGHGGPVTQGAVVGNDWSKRASLCGFFRWSFGCIRIPKARKLQRAIALGEE